MGLESRLGLYLPSIFVNAAFKVRKLPKLEGVAYLEGRLKVLGYGKPFAH